MNDRTAIVNQIEDELGSGGSRTLAEAVYDRLREQGDIDWDDRHGLLLNPAVDLIQLAADVIDGIR